MEQNEQASQEEIEVKEEDEDLRELFQAQMERVMTTAKDDIEERERLVKVKLREEIKQSPKKIMANHLRDRDSLPEITDTVYVMTRVVEIKLEIKGLLREEKKAKENRRVRKMKRQIRKVRKLVVKAGNSIYSRKHWRKATRKEKQIMEELKRNANSNQ